MAERVFDRLKAIYGVQKVGGMYAGIDPDDVMRMWESQIAGFPHAVIGKALQALIDRGSGFPPTLPEFVALCKDYRRSEAVTCDQVLLPPPGKGYTDRDTAKRLLADLGLMVKRVQ